MAKDPMVQRLFPTSTWKALGIIPNTSNYLFMCSRASCSTQIINHSSALEIPAQHKTSHQSCALGSMPNKKHIYTYISLTIGLRPTYKTNNHVYMQWDP